MPDITVGVTTHNLERYICSCMEELLHQTYQSFEIVVYDDCSTDRTRDLLKKFQGKDPERIKLCFGEAPLKSPALARNAILDSGMVQGEYIVFLDGDDRIDKEFLEELYTAAQKHHAEIALCAYDRFEDESGHILCQEMCNFPAEILLPPSDDIVAFINGSLWNKLIAVECIGDLRLPNFQVGEDLSFLLALYDRCRKIACIDKPLIHYRVRAASVIANTPEETVYQFAKELLRLWTASTKLWLRETLELIIFIHIGISMPMRMYGNPNIDLDCLLQWIFTYFEENFNWFRGAKYFRLYSLLRHGIKGAGIWCARLCFRFHRYKLFLWLYRSVNRLFRIDIKF